MHGLLHGVDVIVDCNPVGIGAANLDHYREGGGQSRLPRGEKHAFTGHSFVAHANYESALDRDATRFASCTTTARTLFAVRDSNLLKKARGVLIRRATDSWESDHSSIMNTMVPERSGWLHLRVWLGVGRSWGG